MKRSTEGENAAWAGIGAIKSVRDLIIAGGKNGGGGRKGSRKELYIHFACIQD